MVLESPCGLIRRNGRSRYWVEVGYGRYHQDILPKVFGEIGLRFRTKSSEFNSYFDRISNIFDVKIFCLQGR